MMKSESWNILEPLRDEIKIMNFFGIEFDHNRLSFNYYIT